MQGIINVLKPAGMTSHDVIYVLRKIYGIRKMGHSGTLDPLAAVSYTHLTLPTKA